MGSKTGRINQLISRLQSTILLPFNTDAEFPSPNFPTVIRPSVASWVQTHVWVVFMGEHVLGNRQFGLSLERDGGPLELRQAPVSHGRVRQTEYWDTVPFASLASKFRWASGKLVTWPVCAGYSHESAGVRHIRNHFGSTLPACSAMLGVNCLMFKGLHTVENVSHMGSFLAVRVVFLLWTSLSTGGRCMQKGMWWDKCFQNCFLKLYYYTFLI